MKNKFIITFTLVLSLLYSCNKLLEPLNDTHDTVTRTTDETTYAEGILLTGYSLMPTGREWAFNDVATDDAVSNNKTNTFRQMAEGRWSANFNPTAQWANSMRAINYMNQFLRNIADSVIWGRDTIQTRLFRTRLKGEAYALRGIHRFYALQDVAGPVNGKLMGIQIVNSYMDESSNYNINRETFIRSVKAINADFDSAAICLPVVYGNLASASLIPSNFGYATLNQYNLAMGDRYRQRIQKRIVLAFKGKLALLAASKAYNPSAIPMNDSLWISAAQANADALYNIVLNPTGSRYFEGAIVNATPVIENNSNEMCWRTHNQYVNNTLEKRLFPPSQNGNGEINPTQNLVDAFPMANGYPISHPVSNYDAKNPYTNRDPRLARTILYRGSVFKGSIINTGFGGGMDSKDSITTSTRTGYYLRKLLREDVTFNNDGTSSTQRHFYVHVRFTEVFLNYAEAANEAGGPDYKVPGFTKSARDVIRDIRNRAGIADNTYLNSITDQESMRQLIRNEKRIELCFEGFRFRDLRRWNVSITEAAKGVQITGSVGNYLYNYLEIESRKYQPFMNYGPLPEQDVLRFPALLQNDGWN